MQLNKETKPNQTKPNQRKKMLMQFKLSLNLTLKRSI